jgi:eukaryotic-like serine/threonine-protein kinase
MECVEGETLAKRLEKGPLALEQVLKYGAQLADALDKAHRAGIVHRDLKPGNIMLTSTGAKLLDFGLAKAPVAAVAGGSSSDSLATMSQPLTGAGTIVGTFEYMSPEQVEGKDADPRSDIFALGAVLYEMVTGKRAFEGKTTASTMAAILASDPPPISTIQPMSPPVMDKLVKSCLAKDPDERVQSAHDLRLQLKWIAEGGSQSGVSVPVRVPPRNRERLAWAAAVIILALIAILASRPWSQREPERPLMTTVQLPPKTRLVVNGINGPPAISPDGTRVALVLSEGGNQSIWVRALDTPEATRLPGTDGAYSPFWSPDSHWLAFSANGKLRRVEITGGPPQDICTAADNRGGSWGADGIILLAPKGRSSEIYRVPERGGEPAQVTRFQKGINSHRLAIFPSRWQTFPVSGVADG